MPSFKQLAIDMTDQAAKSSFSKLEKICGYVFVFSLAVLITSVLASRSAGHRMPNTWIYPAMASFVTLFFSWLIYTISICWKSFQRSRSSTNYSSEQLDDQVSIEDALVFRLLKLPARQLSDRRERLELQMKLLERRANATRLFQIAGPPLLVISHALIPAVTAAPNSKLPLNAAADSKVLFLPSGFSTEALVAAFALGAVLAAFSINTELEKLHRVAFVLGAASEKARQ